MRFALFTSVAFATLVLAGSADAQHRDGDARDKPAAGAPATGAPTPLMGAGRGHVTTAPTGKVGSFAGRNRSLHVGDERGRTTTPPMGGTPRATQTGRNGSGAIGQGAVRGKTGGHGNWTGFRKTVTASHRFHSGTYRAPPGWTYRRWSLGAILPSMFWAQQYWLNSYSAYGLQPPPPGTRWVRYGSDALLIDDDSGEVIQVVYGVFY